MAGVTSSRSVCKTLNALMIRRDRGLIAVLMAVSATKGCKVVWIDVAIRARRPHTLVVMTGIDREPRMIERCAGPGSRRMTSCAGCRESGSRVIRIRRAGIIGLVA